MSCANCPGGRRSRSCARYAPAIPATGQTTAPSTPSCQPRFDRSVRRTPSANSIIGSVASPSIFRPVISAAGTFQAKTLKRSPSTLATIIGEVASAFHSAWRLTMRLPRVNCRSVLATSSSTIAARPGRPKASTASGRPMLPQLLNIIGGTKVRGLTRARSAIGQAIIPETRITATPPATKATLPSSWKSSPASEVKTRSGPSASRSLRLPRDDLGVEFFPLRAFVQHHRRIDEFQPRSRGAGIRLAVGRQVIPLDQDRLPFAEHEIVEQHRRMRVRRLPGERDAVDPRDRGLDRIPVDRGASLLQLLGVVVVDGERERHLARGDQAGEQRVPPAHRQPVPRDDLAEKPQALVLADSLDHHREPVDVLGLDPQPPFPSRVQEILVGLRQLVFLH